MRSVLLRIVLVYSDQSTAQLGARVTSSLRKKLGSGFQIAQSVWKTELLKSPRLRLLAAEEARASDVVIVAASEGVDLPEELESWFELWRDRSRDLPGAFVALLHRDWSAREETVSDRLRDMATQARMEFFCHSEWGEEELLPEGIWSEWGSRGRRAGMGMPACSG